MTEEEIFDAALQLPIAERNDFARTACGDDPKLYESVRRLLELHEKSSDFMARPAIEMLVEPSVPEETETQLGPYTLKGLLGQGGMGMVYLATQSHPVAREVAIKVIKPGLDTAEVLARFRAEQRALAVMDHPYIAKVLEAGATQRGRPYFVMERVSGIPITEFCNQEKLSIEKRLSLFSDVCMAVQHAHSKSIIHRDIKPSNVLVTVRDGQPVPKVIDFGIAKALDPESQEFTLVTQNMQVLGTPMYMSPEQASTNGMDLDTRTDIYSLGVLLFELLTGSPPFNRERMHTASFDEVRRIIREVDPPKPSAMVDTRSSQSRHTTAQDLLEAKRLSRRLRGDLDWIVMKAIEKDRELRYATANDFASDIRRFLNFETVLASPPSNLYRLKRTLWRYRAVVAVASAMLGLSLLGTTGTAYGLLMSQKANQELAKSLENEARERSEAESQRAIAEAVIAFLNDDLLAAVTPSVAPGKGQAVTMREVLDSAAERIETAAQTGGKFFDKPQVESRIRLVLAQTYLALGLPQVAQVQLTRAQQLMPDLVSALASAQSPDNLNVGILIAQSQADAELGNLAQAEETARRVVEIRLSQHAPDSEPVTEAKHMLAYVLFRVGKYAEACELFEECLKHRRQSWGEDNSSTLRTQATIAACYLKMNEYTIAEGLIDALMPKARASKDTFVLARVLGDLAEVRSHQGQYDEAQILINEALGLNDKLYGAAHGETLNLVALSAIVAAKRQDWPKALESFHRVYDFQLNASGPIGVSTVSARHNLAVGYLKSNDLDKAMEIIVNQLNEVTSALGNDNLWIRRTYNLIGLIGDTLHGQGRLEDALTMHRLLEVHVRDLADTTQPKPTDVHRAAIFFADAKCSQLRDLPQALRYIERAVALQKASPDERAETFNKDLDRIRELNQSALNQQASSQ